MNILQASAGSQLKPQVGITVELFIFVSREYDFEVFPFHGVEGSLPLASSEQGPG